MGRESFSFTVLIFGVFASAQIHHQNADQLTLPAASKQWRGHQAHVPTFEIPYAPGVLQAIHSRGNGGGFYYSVPVGQANRKQESSVPVSRIPEVSGGKKQPVVVKKLVSKKRVDQYPKKSAQKKKEDRFRQYIIKNKGTYTKAGQPIKNNPQSQVLQWQVAAIPPPFRGQHQIISNRYQPQQPSNFPWTYPQEQNQQQPQPENPQPTQPQPGYPQSPQPIQPQPGYPQSPQPIQPQPGYPQSPQPIQPQPGYPQPQPIQPQPGYPQSPQPIQPQPGYPQSPQPIQPQPGYPQSPQPIQPQPGYPQPQPIQPQPGYPQSPQPIQPQPGYPQSPQPIQPQPGYPQQPQPLEPTQSQLPSYPPIEPLPEEPQPEEPSLQPEYPEQPETVDPAAQPELEQPDESLPGSPGSNEVTEEISEPIDQTGTQEEISEGVGNKPTNVACKKPRGQFASPSACNRFLNCWDDVAVEQECGGTLLFNEEFGYCDYPQNVDCGDRPIERPDPIQAESGCPVPFGTFRDSSNCGAFIVCVDSKPNQFVCPSGLAYNDEIGVCDYEYRVDCKGLPLLPAPEEPAVGEQGENNVEEQGPFQQEQGAQQPESETPVIGPTNEESENQQPPEQSPGLPSGGYPGLPRFPSSCRHGVVTRLAADCRAVTTCVRGHTRLLTCPIGYSFDVPTHMCLPFVQARCGL